MRILYRPIMSLRMRAGWARPLLSQINVNQRLSIVQFFLSSNQSSNASSQRVFDRQAKRRQREWSITRPDSHVFDYLKDEFGYRLADKLFDIKRWPIIQQIHLLLLTQFKLTDSNCRTFDVAVELSSGKGFIAQHLTKVNAISNWSGPLWLICLSCSITHSFRSQN